MVPVATYGQQAMMLSSRVGESIDSTERVYFNLFRDINGFVSARAASRTDSSVDILITRNDRGGNDTVISMTRKAALELGRYIDHYERLFQGEESKVDLKEIRSYARPQKMFNDDAISLVVTTRSGEVVEGPVVMADDSLIVLLPHSLRDDWSTIDRDARVLTPLQIVEVHDRRNYFERLGNQIAVPVEGNDTVYRREVLPALIDRTLFYATPSPEIQHLIERSTIGDSSVSMPAATVEEIYGRFMPAKIHLSASFISPLQYSNRSVRYTADPGIKGAYIINLPLRNWTIGADYSPFDMMRIGATYSIRPQPAYPADSISDYQNVYGNEFEGLLKAVPVLHGRFLNSLFNRFDVIVGAGLIFGSYTIDTRVAPPPDYDLVAPDHYSMERSLLGQVFLVGTSYYLTREISLGLEYRARNIPEIEVEEYVMERTFGAIHRWLKTNQTHTIPLSTEELLFALQLHI
jgi:hypothetical protein